MWSDRHCGESQGSETCLCRHKIGIESGYYALLACITEKADEATVNLYIDLIQRKNMKENWSQTLSNGMFT